MSVKKITLRLVAMLLLLAMVFCVFACTKDEGPTNNNDVTTNESDFPFPKQTYGAEFNILYPNTGIYKNYYFGEACEGSDSIRSALQERAALVQNYLGVTVKGSPVAEYDEIYGTVETDVMSGLNSYELVLTHSYLGITSLLTGGFLTDFYSLDDIDLEADYWNADALESLEVNGKAYLGLSDFMISDPTNVYFNKTMAETYGVDNLYSLVKEGKWTLDEFKKQAARVDINNPEGIGKEGTYGLGAMADWHFLSFVDACEVEWLEDLGGYKALKMGSDNQRYLSLYEWCESLADEDYVYMWNYGDNSNSTNIGKGKCLFTLDSLKNAYNYRDSGVTFGILPYPKFNTEQESYRSFDWSGMMCIPATSEANLPMIGQTLECLSYYSADTITVAYYEKLLGARLAEAPDDAEMLDYIFDNIVLNPTINFIGKANTDLGILVYTIPKMLRAKCSDTTISTITTNWASYRSNAQQTIDSFLNSKNS